MTKAQTDKPVTVMQAVDWLRAISDWLLENDYDMTLPSGILDTDPLDIAEALAREQAERDTIAGAAGEDVRGALDDALFEIAQICRSTSSFAVVGATKRDREIGAVLQKLIAEHTSPLVEALRPFARLAGPINGEPGRMSYIDAIGGPNGTDELKISTYVGDGTRIEVMDAADFRRAAVTLAALSPNQGGA